MTFIDINKDSYHGVADSLEGVAAVGILVVAEDSRAAAAVGGKVAEGSLVEGSLAADILVVGSLVEGILVGHMVVVDNQLEDNFAEVVVVRMVAVVVDTHRFVAVRKGKEHQLLVEVQKTLQ